MKKSYLLTLMLIIPLLSSGGGIKINFQSGKGTWGMADNKLFNTYVVKRLPLPVRQTDNFPAYWFYQGSVQFGVSEKLGIGPVYSFYSTGSRYSLADYSGNYTYDNLIHAHSPGLTAHYRLFMLKKIEAGLYAAGGMIFSKLKMEEKLELPDAKILHTEERAFKSTGFFAEPGLSLNYKFKFLEPGLRAGYHIPVAGNKLEEKKTGDPLFLPNSAKVRTGWNGIRIALSLSLYLQ